MARAQGHAAIVLSRPLAVLRGRDGGTRSEAVAMMVWQMGPSERVYDLLLNTDMLVAAVEELLAQDS